MTLPPNVEPDVPDPVPLNWAVLRSPEWVQWKSPLNTKRLNSQGDGCEPPRSLHCRFEYSWNRSQSARLFLPPELCCCVCLCTPFVGLLTKMGVLRPGPLSYPPSHQPRPFWEKKNPIAGSPGAPKERPSNVLNTPRPWLTLGFMGVMFLLLFFFLLINIGFHRGLAFVGFQREGEQKLKNNKIAVKWLEFNHQATRSKHVKCVPTTTGGSFSE